jgi:YaiO family outer membrane protein
MRVTLFTLTILSLCFSYTCNAQGDAIAQARALAFDGKRPEALQAIERYLQAEPDDTDARTLHGTILSWEGRYEEARRELDLVVDRFPLHSDATPALIQVELLSGHADRAERLARAALAKSPADATLQLYRARALNNLRQSAQALRVLNGLLETDPANAPARVLSESLQEQSWRWTSNLSRTHEWFNDARAAWQETAASVSYQAGFGSMTARFSEANRFSISSRQVELDAYPSLRPGTYLYLNAGGSADRNLYPGYRLGAEAFQKLSYGLEASGGMRRLGFASAVNVYTGSLAKYYGNWLLTARALITPGTDGKSLSQQYSLRRYFADGTSSAGIRVGTGASPILNGTLNEIEVLRSNSIQGDLSWRLARRWTVNTSVGHSREARLFRDNLHHNSISGGLNCRF